MRARLAVLAVAGLIAVLGVTAITASGTGHEAEVRITAQRLADGRTEFALQQREADDRWSERLLPRARFFPATATVGRWLSSTPLTVRSPGAGDDAEGAEVRITAQRLADGRTEFALQEREAEGEWGERLLPRARFFPATATVGRWLSSTPLTVSLPDTAEDGGSVASDRAALVAFYNATEGASWTTSTNWLSDRPLDEWYGVATSSDGRVTHLLLWDNQLTGPIPAALGDLTKLEFLDLSGNELTGPLPAELGSLSHLEILILDENKLTGSIPAEMGDLTNLRWLWLSDNELTGPIPAQLGDLTNLEWLKLGDNQLTGCLPVGWRDVSLNDLREVDLPDCREVSSDTGQDVGSVASDRAALVALYNATGGARWGTRTNWLSGRPIDEWSGVTTNSVGRVTRLSLLRNELTGPIPAELGNLSHLRALDLDRNELAGPIPAELGSLTNLEWLSLWGNELTGPIPAWLGDLTNLELVALGNNELTGPIPAELGDLTNLGTLMLHNNQLTGPIPAELGDLTNLVTLWLSGNELTGCVPGGLRDVALNDLGDLGLPDCG